ncbi:MAG: hypothetical protein GY884_05840 [Proteobacteria bacterium]|nr:hypothetical protein [Pseudomonadota bacterium]
MATKNCPSCHEDVPAAAPRCKHCFHDFTDEEAAAPKGRGLVGLLGLIAAMCVMGALTFWFVSGRAGQEMIVIDEETSSIVFTTKYSDHTETDRVRFDEVSSVEVVMGDGEATWEVAVVTLNGERRVVNLSDDKNLKGYAEHIAAVMDKPLVEKSEARGFGDLGTGGQAPPQ